MHADIQSLRRIDVFFSDRIVSSWMNHLNRVQELTLSDYIVPLEVHVRFSDPDADAERVCVCVCVPIAVSTSSYKLRTLTLIARDKHALLAILMMRHNYDQVTNSQVVKSSIY